GDNRRQPPPGRGAQGAPRRGGLGPAQGGPRPPRPRAPPAAPGVERVNSALKDSYGGRHVRVRGHAKVACHPFFGILALTVHRLMRLNV
ncbi:MAG: hypothetical protein OXF07_09400, partial [Rhodobacter sp.]|nr:hypothetical protein [Rhodobacter sp.]